MGKSRKSLISDNFRTDIMTVMIRQLSSLWWDPFTAPRALFMPFSDNHIRPICQQTAQATELTPSKWDFVCNLNGQPAQGSSETLQTYGNGELGPEGSSCLGMYIYSFYT